MREIEKILKLLEEKKISAEEAYRLIEALREKEKVEKREEETFDLLDIGKVVSEAVKTAFSAVPHAIRSSFKKRTIDESLELGDSERIEIQISAGDAHIETSEDPEIILHGVGDYTYEKGILRISGDLDIRIPETKELALTVGAGDVDGRIKGDKVSISIKAGDGNFDVSTREADIVVKMGDLDINLREAPVHAEFGCEMGDLSIRLPDEYHGTVEANVTLGSFEMEKEGYRKEGGRFVFGSGGKSRIVVSCKMGDVGIR